jgi:hypothetical protein
MSATKIEWDNFSNCPTAFRRSMPNILVGKVRRGAFIKSTRLNAESVATSARLADKWLTIFPVLLIGEESIELIEK